MLLGQPHITMKCQRIFFFFALCLIKSEHQSLFHGFSYCMCKHVRLRSVHRLARVSDILSGVEDPECQTSQKVT